MGVLISVLQLLRKNCGYRFVISRVFEYFSCTSRKLFILFVLTLTIFYVWASFRSLSVVVLAQGEVVPASHVKSVQHMEGGIIRKISVNEGDFITQGQILLSLDPTIRGADVAELQERLQSLRIRKIRLIAELGQYHEFDFVEYYKSTSKLDEVSTNASFFLPQSVPIKRLTQEENLFYSRRIQLEHQRDIQRQLIAQHKFHGEEISARLSKNKVSIELLKEQVNISEKLLQESLSNRMSHIDLLRRLAEINGGIAEDEAALRRTLAMREESQKRLALVTDVFLLSVREVLQETLENTHTLEQRLLKNNDSLHRTVVRAPVAGIVKSLYVTTLGGVLTPGAVVADIVPVNDELLIEAKLATGDIGYVFPQQDVLIRLASADSLRFSAVKGVVENLSPDTLLTADGDAYFKVRIRAEQSHFSNRAGETFKWIPGLLVHCHILIGRRTIMDYILQPFIQPFSLAMRER